MKQFNLFIVLFCCLFGNIAFSQTYEGISTQTYDFKIGVSELVIAQTSVKLVDINNNNSIDADEKNKIIFVVENKSNTAANNVVTDIYLTKTMSGLTFVKSQNLGTINAGEKKQVELNVSSNQEISSGNVEFNIKVKDANNIASNSIKFSVTTSAYIPPEIVMETKEVEKVISQELQNVTQKMRDDKVITDAVETKVVAEVKEEINQQGESEINLKVMYQYEVKKNEDIVTNFDKQTDDFPPGAYTLSTSKAARIIMSVMKSTIEAELDKYLLSGRKVTIKITGSTDASPIKTKIPYGGEYGELKEQAYFLNGLFDYVTVTSASGITQNSQLAFLRTYAVRDFISKNISSLKLTDNTFEHYAVISSEVGAEFRRISVELVIHDAFSDKVKDVPVIVNDDVFVPFCDIDNDIPVNPNKQSFVYCLVVGNEKYSSKQNKLTVEQDVPFAMQDAKTFREYALKTIGVEDDNLKLVLNATAGEMNSAINWLVDKTKNAINSGNNASIIFYYAGHGMPDKDSIPYIIPTDVMASDLKLAINLPDLYKKLSNTGAKNITIFLDACFSGGARNQNLTEGARDGIKRTPKEAVTLDNLIVFSATSENQSAWAYNSKQHGIFTYFLLKKLKETKGEINYNDLFESLKYNVNDKALDLDKPIQTPQVNVSKNKQNTWKTMKLK